MLSAIFDSVTVLFPYLSVGIVLSTMLLPCTTTARKPVPPEPSASSAASAAALPLLICDDETVPSPTSEACVWMI